MTAKESVFLTELKIWDSPTNQKTKVEACDAMLYNTDTTVFLLN